MKFRHSFYINEFFIIHLPFMELSLPSRLAIFSKSGYERRYKVVYEKWNSI